MTEPRGVSESLAAQPFDEASERFAQWLDGRVLAAGGGDGTDRLDVDPAATFWLGRLASEEEVQNNPIGERAERLDPCAIGIRLRPAGSPPWTFSATAAVRAWIKEDKDTTSDPSRPWRRLDRIVVPVTLHLTAEDTEVAAGRSEIAAALSRAGAPGLYAEIRVELEQWHSEPELVIQLKISNYGGYRRV